MARILICDDAMFMRGALKKIVEAEGHTVVAEADGGRTCIQKCNQWNPDIILMDITMDDMDGITATQKIKETNKDVTIIMVSAMGQQEKVVAAIASGASDFIVKPFEAERVIQCISKYC